MASKNEYEMLFQLNARMNGGFSGTFSKAQAEFTRLGKEIQSLHKVQGDIASYQKQQSAIEATRSKLESLQKQHDLLQKEINETTGSTASLEREKVKLEERIKNTEVALERQSQKLETTSTRLKEAGVDTSNLSQKDAELTTRIKELQAEQDKAAEGATDFGTRATRAFDAAGQALAAAGITVALKEITDAFVECVGVAADFEETMSTVEALSQAGAQEMAALTAEAKELGATTKFTAKESAEAMSYMAMAGWDAKDMLSGMNGVLQLAAASGEDLAMVSDIVTDSLSAFGLTARDTAHFSDVLASAAANSNTNVAIMGETFKMSASVAGALGYSIEDVAVAMGLMANSGVKGSIAGTALRNTFNGLLEGVTLTGKAFGEYEYSAVKADGTMKDFGATIDELRRYFDRMTEAERVNNAMAIAGQRGYNGLLAILNATDADYASLTDSINNCTGAAERMAKVKMDNLNGQLTLMNSAWDALKTTIGEQFNPELRDLAEIGTDVLGWINDFAKENPSLVKGVMVGAGAFGALGTAIIGVNAAIKLFKALNVASLFTGPAGILLGAAGALSVVASAVVVAKDAVSEYTEVLGTHRDAERAYQDSIAAIDDEANATYSLIAQLRELSGQSEKTEADQAKIANIVDRLNASIPELNLSYDKETNVLNGLSDSTYEYAKALYEAKKAQEDVARSVELEYSIPEMEEAVEDAKKELVELLESTHISATNPFGMAKLAAYAFSTKDLIETLEEYDALQDSLTDYYDAQEAATEATADASTVIENATERAMELAAAYREAYEEAKESFSGQFGLFDEAQASADATVSAAQKALDSQLAYWQGYAENVEFLRGMSAEELHTTQENLDALISYLSTGTPEAAGLIADVVRNVREGNIETVGTMADTIGAVSEMQDYAAQEMSAWTTGLVEQTEQLIRDMEDELEALDMSEEAAEYGRETIRAWIRGAASGEMLEEVRQAFASVWMAAEGTLANIAAARPAQTPTYSDSAYYANSTRGYASGTESAAPGWARVGENGPELMFFHGGEKVLNAAQTAAVQNASAVPAVQAGARSGGNSYSFAPSYNISGAANASELEAVLRQHDEDLHEQFLDWLEEADIEEARRAY